MRKILVLAIVVGGVWQLSQHGLPTSASVEVYSESGDPLVKVISIENCGVSCRMATDELKRRRVAFRQDTPQFSIEITLTSGSPDSS